LNRTDLLKSYRETQIKTANQGRLVVMLYDGAIRFINQALEGLNESPRRYDRINNNIVRAQDIVAELMVALDFERGGDLARSLFSLYLYINRRLLDANLKKDPAPLREVKQHLCELRSAWAQIAERRGHESPAAGGEEAGGSNGVNLAG
jgi:flagellar protein FliS